MVKDLTKEIMQSRNSIKFLEERTEVAKALYDKQRNVYFDLLCKAKRHYFWQINTNAVSDSRKI